jgi:poly(3-hydroxybutyrate) depolymerase
VDRCADAGGDPFRDLRGLFQRAFYSRADGSLQPFAIYLPHDYNGKESLPLLVLLHGAGGDHWEILQSAANLDGHSIYASALEREPGKPRFILCAPLARGAAGYQYLAEMDVLQMLDEVQHDYRIDKERAYLGGWFMGGTGTWTLATRYPDRFAAILPISGAVDSSLMANLRHVPSWNFFGLGDRTVSPGYLQITETAVRRTGIPYHGGMKERTFVWGPDADHWLGYRMAGSWDETESILSPYRRISLPRTVSLEGTDLRHNRAYWVRIDAFERYFEPSRLQAEIQNNRIEIQSSNVGNSRCFLTTHWWT